MGRTEQKRENWERRRAIVERFATSGQRTEEFCKQEGLSFYAFSKWRSRLKQLDREANTLENATLNPASVFVEVKREKDRTPSPTCASYATAEILFPNQIRIELRCTSAELRELMGVLHRC